MLVSLKYLQRNAHLLFFDRPGNMIEYCVYVPVKNECPKNQHPEPLFHTAALSTMAVKIQSVAHLCVHPLKDSSYTVGSVIIRSLALVATKAFDANSVADILF